MEAKVEEAANEIKRLKACINNLISVQALPAIWSGGKPSHIVSASLDVLMNMLSLDFAYARLKDSTGGASLEMTRLAQDRNLTAQPQMIGRALNSWLGDFPHTSPLHVRNPIGDGDISVLLLRLGLQAELGMFVAGSKRADFPTQTERLLLNLAANQAVIGLQEARLLSEQKRVAEELDQRVAQRTSQLLAANEELQKEIAERKRAEEKLRRSKAFLTEGQRISHTGSWSWDVSSGKVAWSEEHFRIFGFDPEKTEPSLQLFLETVHPEDRSFIEQGLEEATRNKNGFDMEFRIALADGSIKHVQGVGRPVVGESGEVDRYVGTTVDITERKRGEALFSGEKRLLEMIATGVALKEILNCLCVIIEEYRPGTLASVLLLRPDGLHLDSVAGPSLPKGWTQQMEKLPIGPCAGSCGTAAYRGSRVIVSDIATDPLWEVPEHRAAALGHGLRASWSNPILSSEGKVLGTFCIYERATRSPNLHDLEVIEKATYLARVAIERDRAETDLRTSEQKYRDLIDASPDAICVLDADSKCVLVNPAGIELAGRPEEELIGSSVTDTYIPEELHLFRDRIDKLKAEGSFRFERKFLRKNGEVIPVEVSLSALRGQYYQAIIRDISQRKRREALLAGENRVLEMVAKGDSLADILDNLCLLVEEQSSGVLASILLMDPNGKQLRHGAAPHLPKTYTEAIDGTFIGPAVGSCGTAAYRAEQVIVSDIAVDPLWADFRDLALRHSLYACWSTPIFSSEGKVIGTFAMYYREPRSPSQREQDTIKHITHLAGIAIQRKLAEVARRESESYLAEAQRLSHTGSWAWTPATGEIRYWSEETYRVLGFDPKAGSPRLEIFFQRLCSEDQDRVRELFENAVRKQVDFETDYRIVHPSGDIKDIHAVGHPVCDETGYLVEFVGTVIDVTDRKRAEEELRRSEANLAEAQRLSHTGSFGCKFSSGEMFWSEETFGIFGYNRATPPAVEAILQRVHPEDQARVQERVHLAASEGKACDLEYRLLMPDDSVKHVHVMAHAAKDEPGGFEFVGAVIDVTDRKRAEEELRTSESRYRHLVDTTPAFIHTRLPNGDVDFFNRGWLEYVGLPLKDLLGWGWTCMIHPEDVETIVAKWRSALEAGEPFVGESRVRRADGEYRWFLHREEPLRNEAGEIVKWYGSSIEIQERKIAEEAIREQETQLRQILDLTPQHIGVLAPDGSRLYVNQTALEYFGITLEQWREPGRVPNSLAHPEDREHFLYERKKRFL